MSSSDRKFNTLVLGSGGREAAIFSKLEESENIKNLYILPGNAGQLENSLKGKVEDLAEIENFISKLEIDLMVVGPEQPLADGIKDHFAKVKPDLLVFGPDKQGAQLEASKSFTYDF